MPKPGLSLVGFLDPPQAVNYFRNACVLPDGTTDADLVALHQLAIAKLGAPTPRAGDPEILDLPSSAAAHVAQLSAVPWAQSILQSPGMTGWEAKLVEIDPLLSLQLSVMTERSDHHCGALNNPATDELLPVTLPLVQPKGEFIISPITPTSQSVIIKAKDLNFQMMNWGVFPMNANGAETHFAGMEFRSSSVFVYVARFNGLCYLANGFHRAYGSRKAGATHIPCIFRDAGTPEEIGIRQDGVTFSLQRLEAADPPTVGHYTQDRALEVTLRSLERILHVSWSQYTLPED